jgi:uncharacterized protein (TIGR03067 family)
VSVGHGDEAKGGADEIKKLQGSWKPVSALMGGQPFPQPVLDIMKLVVADGRYTVTIGEQKDEGMCKVDPTKSPRAMDIEGTKGPNQGKKILCIYEFKDETLRVCYDLSGKARPTEFKSKPETPLFLVEYRREKP